MATSSTTVDVSSFTTDAKFRTWGSAVSAAIAAAGFVQTADTGQINWTTVARPTTNAVAGYEIWRFNDTLQSTRPVFFKLEYGSNGNTSGQAPGTYLTVGTGSDGAGSVTGLGMARTLAYTSSVSASSNTTCLVGAAFSSSAGAGVIMAGLNPVTSTGSHAGLWVISRTCDTSGAPTGAGLVVHRNSAATQTVMSCVNYDTSSALSARAVGCGVLARDMSISSGDTLQLYRHYALVPTPKPVHGLVTYYSTDVSTGSTFTAAPYGVSHTYFAMGSRLDGCDSSSTSSLYGAVIWE